MKGEWKVTKTINRDHWAYGVYRLRDAEKPNHGRNREYDTIGYVSNRREAADRADELNAEDKPNE